MSWKSIMPRAQNILGVKLTPLKLSFLQEPGSSFLMDRICKLASITDHKIVPVICTHLQYSQDIFPDDFKLTSLFPATKHERRFPHSMLIPMVGQYILGEPNPELLTLCQKMGQIYAIISLAVALHRTVLDLSSPPLHPKMDPTWLKNMELGNKLAVLAGDRLLATASVELGSYHIPKIVGMISKAIADSIRAEFSDLATNVIAPDSELVSLSKMWFEHIRLRHGVLLGECCAATVVLGSSSRKSSDVLLQSAREFGSSWACLTRLLDEKDFTGTVKINLADRPKTLTDFGFTESGLPEPTLADVCWFFSKDFTRVPSLYKSLATSLIAKLQGSLKGLLQPGVAKNDVHLLVEECVDLLIKEAS